MTNDALAAALRILRGAASPRDVARVQAILPRRERAELFRLATEELEADTHEVVPELGHDPRLREG